MALILVGCTAAQRERSNTAGLAIAEAALACDAGQSAYAMGSGDYSEKNPILGRRPSDTGIALYMTGTMIVTAVAWWLLPSRWRPAAWGPVAAIEVESIAVNEIAGVPLCGI